MADTLLSDIQTLAEDNDSQIDMGRAFNKEKVSFAGYTAAGAIADDSVVVLTEIPVDAFISSIRFWSDDLGSTGLFNLGFYPGSKKASDLVVADAVDEDALATAIDVNAAAVADSELRFEAANISTVGKKAWELAGLSARPAYGFFYLALTASEATTAAGDMAALVRFSE